MVGFVVADEFTRLLEGVVLAGFVVTLEVTGRLVVVVAGLVLVAGLAVAVLVEGRACVAGVRLMICCALW